MPTAKPFKVAGMVTALQLHAGRQREGARRGLLLGAEHVLQVADTLVPLEEGTLARSGVASIDDNELTAAVSYDTPYAVKQHEDMTLQHDPGRQAKYLSTPLETEAPVVLQLIAREAGQAYR